MSQSGYTPFLIYASGTATNVPSSSNLTSGSTGAELAINYYDGKLFYKDNTGTVQVLATKATTAGTFSSAVTLSAGGTSTTPTSSDNSTNIATTAFVKTALPTLPLSASNGGTGEAGTITGVLYGNGTSAHTQASAAQIVSAIGSTPVSYANNVSGGYVTSVNGSQGAVTVGGVGTGQSWQNVTGSRSIGSSYTNSTSNPIMVVVSVLNGNNTATLNFYVGGVQVGYVSHDLTSVGNSVGSPITFIVPVGASYSTSGSCTSYLWAELR